MNANQRMSGRVPGWVLSLLAVASSEIRSRGFKHPLIHSKDAPAVSAHAQNLLPFSKPMLKSLMLEIERDAPDLFELVRSTVFRWALAHGFAKTIDHSHLYIATGQSLETQSLKHLKKLFGMLDFFCINDTTDDAKDSDPRLLQIHQNLSALLPEASHCELIHSSADTIPRLQVNGIH